MGILRNVAKGIAAFFFSLFLTSLLITFLFYNITRYDTTKQILTPVFKSILLKNITSQEIEKLYSSVSSYCKFNTNITLPMDNITLSCSEILNKNPDTLPNLIAEKIFENFYYKTYNCDFIECLKNIKSNEDLAIFFSLKAYNFFERLIWQIFIGTILSGFILFLLIETWPGRFKFFGFEFLSVGIFFFLIPYFKDSLTQKIPKEIFEIENVLNMISNQLSSIFFIFFLLGILFISAWILVKIFGKKSK
mgnify:CR=1 FL=1